MEQGTRTRSDRSEAINSSLLHLGGGVATIGVAGDAAVELVPSSLLTLIRSAPLSRIRIVEGTPEDLLEKLSLGDIDVAVGPRLATEPCQEIAREDLGSEPFHVVARPRHPVFRRGELEWHHLVGYRWILWPRHTRMRAALESTLEAQGLDKPVSALESDSIASTIALINRTNLLGVVPNRTARRFSRLETLRIVPLRIVESDTTTLYWRANRKQPTVVALALDCIRAFVDHSGRGSESVGTGSVALL